MRQRKNQIALVVIAVLTALSALTLAFETISIGTFERGVKGNPAGLNLGLDLQGGTHLVYRAESADVTQEQMEGVADIITQRVNRFGVSEAVVQLKGQNEIVIQLPGVKDIDEAKRLIGGTAQLDFRQCADASVTGGSSCGAWEPAAGEGNGGVQKHLTGEFMRPTATLVADPNSGLPEVSFEFNNEGAKLFEQITRRLIGKPLGIFLDNQLVSAPTVQSVISDRGRITGITASQGRVLAIQLNAGSLPVPIKVVREEDVSATLGKDSLDKSYTAAAVGLGLVMLFMVLYYRFLGVVASLSLIVYSALVLSLFKLSGVTLTLSGIAAFVISVGMAVDANIIIFERMREELRSGRSLGAAIETGFDRAWTAIRDSNVTTLILVAILWWFGDQLGEPKIIGFAVTLIIAILVSMFTAIIVTRTFLRLTVGTAIGKRTALFAPVKHQEQAPRPALGA
ncbi:MAG: protein translocase subunit SecD [Dehalococcoidia bacterium]|nr:protein translocase subunit SecD [Dehalococcoidia bacterium]